jgi:hypothetical protein
MGHSLKGTAKIYNNPTDDQIRIAWQILFTRCLHGNQDDARQRAQDNVRA